MSVRLGINCAANHKCPNPLCQSFSNAITNGLLESNCSEATPKFPNSFPTTKSKSGQQGSNQQFEMSQVENFHPNCPAADEREALIFLCRDQNLPGLALCTNCRRCKPTPDWPSCFFRRVSWR